MEGLLRLSLELVNVHHTMARWFSRFHAPRQELADFLASTKGLKVYSRLQAPQEHKAAKRNYPLAFSQTPVDPMEQRKARKDLEDFDTSSSDHDAKYFSLTRYLSDAVMMYRFSKLGLLLHLITVTVLFYVGLLVSSPLVSRLRRCSFLGHWRLLEPAYRDMELARFQRRIKFSVLAEYD